MLERRQDSSNNKGLMLYNKFSYLSAKNLFLHNGWTNLKIASIILLAYVIFCHTSSLFYYLIVGLNIFFLATFFIKIVVFMVGVFSKIGKVPEEEYLNIKDEDLPIYSVLLPLYKEARVLPKLLHGIYNLDYPAEKLDIKVVLDEDDKVTIEKAHEMLDSYNFDLVIVPDAQPHTKPRACTYALNFVKGEFVTIYDAEDSPDKYQLKKSVYRFKGLDEKVICIQARLNYFNRNENVLTKMFALEYASWFDFMIKGLKFFKVPIPLGGTSNHFKTEKLIEMGGWDAYNVTEDADLGVRIERFGYETDLLDSLTKEEAPIALIPWLKQRTRWIKGFMQTYFVHMRSPKLLFKQLGFWRFIGFQIFIGSPFVVFLTTPILMVVSVLRLMGFIEIANIYNYAVLLKFNFYSTFFAMLFCALYISLKYKWKECLVYSLLFPFYWMLHAVASFRALWQLIKAPYYWDKTEHGVTEFTLKGQKHVISQESFVGETEEE